MTDQPTIRASEADIVMHCGLAGQPPTTEIDQSGPEADLGRAVHAALEHWVNAGCVGEPEAQPFANQHSVDRQAVEALIAVAPPALAQIKEDLSNAKAEIKVDGGGVRGRLDVLALLMAGNKLFGAANLDWKTGRDSDGGKPMQRLAYASAIEARYGMPAQGYVYTAEIWLASEEIIETRYDLDVINGFRAKLVEQLKYAKASPGKHCKWCNHRFDCAPREQYIRSAVTTLVELGPDDIAKDKLAELWDQSRMMAKALKHYETIVDNWVDEHGGLDLPDGRRIVHGTKNIEAIDARRAWPVMKAAGLNDIDINAAINVGKTKLLDLVAARAPRGQKGDQKKAVMVALDEAGAVSRTKAKYRKIIKP